MNIKKIQQFALNVEHDFMTSNEQELIKVVAEIDGCVLGRELGYTHAQAYFYYKLDPNGTYHDIQNWSRIYREVNVNYTTSYDAILPVIQKQTFPTKERIIRILTANNPDGIGSSEFIVSDLIMCLESTPLQLCEALVKACL